MIDEKMEAALNGQINAELYSAYLYLSMEAFFHSKSLKGFARWMRVQALEEMTHADRIAAHVISRGGRVTLDSIGRPGSSWKSPADVFEHVLAHERKVTSLIHELVELAALRKDHAALTILQWFVTEQVEEEASAQEILEQLAMVAEDGRGLLMLDRELGARVFTPPPAAGA
jgi:ferritin